MQSDRYMRAVLTMIAVCLVWICLRDVVIVETAHAAGTMDVRIVGVHPYAGDIDVNVQNWPVSLQKWP